jgi:hypothetical protein
MERGLLIISAADDSLRPRRFCRWIGDQPLGCDFPLGGESLAATSAARHYTSCRMHLNHVVSLSSRSFCGVVPFALGRIRGGRRPARDVSDQNQMYQKVCLSNSPISKHYNR